MGMKIIDQITPELKSELEQINRDCIRNHLPCPPQTFVTLDVRNPDGEHVLSQKFKSNSWVRNMHNLLVMQLMDAASNTGGTTFGAGKLPIKDLSNTDRQASGKLAGFAYNTTLGDAGTLVGPAGYVDRGICIGTGTSAESLESCAMAALIAAGSGAGQMVANAQSATAYAYDSGTKKWTATLVRIFNNNSGSTITIGEAGICATMKVSSTSFWALLCRDLVSPTVAIVNGASVTVTYTIEYTFPG